MQPISCSCFQYRNLRTVSLRDRVPNQMSERPWNQITDNPGLSSTREQEFLLGPKGYEYITHVPLLGLVNYILLFLDFLWNESALKCCKPVFS